MSLEAEVEELEALIALKKLRREVIAEVQDPRHRTRSHFKRGTYAAGCRGPLCSQINAEYCARNESMPRPGRAYRLRAKRLEMGITLREIAAVTGTRYESPPREVRWPDPAWLANSA
jgi:hypothetical protein